MCGILEAAARLWLLEERVGGEEVKSTTAKYTLRQFVDEGSRECWLKKMLVGCGF